MEENRLSERSPEFNEGIFNKLFNELQPLRKKLASEVNPKLFNVHYNDVVSFFDIKFLFVYNKYCAEYDENRMKATLINSLKTYKFRLLRQSQTLKNSVNTNSSSLEELVLDIPDQQTEVNELLSDVMSYMKQNLSQEAWEIFRIEIEPPLYIINRLIYRGYNKSIPLEVLADYLGLTTDEEYRRLERIRKQIRKATRACRDSL